MKKIIIVSLFLFVFGLSNILTADEPNNPKPQENKVEKKKDNNNKHHKESHNQKGKQNEPIGFSEKQIDGTEAVCPVTKEKFKITKETPYSEYRGKYYYFCCDGCKPLFDKEPEKYIK